MKKARCYDIKRNQIYPQGKPQDIWQPTNSPAIKKQCPSPGLIDTELRVYSINRRCWKLWERNGECTVVNLKIEALTNTVKWYIQNQSWWNRV